MCRLANVKFIREKKLLAAYYSEIAQDTGKFCFGIKDTLHALDGGAVETLIVWENMDLERRTIKNISTGEEEVVYSNKQFGPEYEIVDSMPLLEWFTANYKSFGADLQFVTDRSQEGSQFCKGFGGIGGMLRYQVDFAAADVSEYVGEEEDGGGGGFNSDDDFDDFI